MEAKTYTLYRSSRFDGVRLIKLATTLAMVSGAAVILYVAWVFGYGYIEARGGQADLRSLFHISGNGSTDPDYIARQAAAAGASLANLDPVGEISIPKIGSKWMIVQGADKEALKKGPGHIPETALPGAGGNTAIAGDRVLYGAPFLKLNELAPGDQVMVKMSYATLVYEVRESFIVTPDDTSVLQPVGYDALTLLTCDPPWDIKQRIIVRARLADVLPAGSEI